MSNQNNSENNEPKKVVTRFAPSPTGFMHIGGVRTALYAWAFARKHGGVFILRIEDTDKAREVEGSIEHIIESLKWLGIEWNEGPDIGGPNAPYLQSQRLESYKQYANILIDKGLAYADPYSKEQLEDFRKKAEVEKRPFLYRDHRPENIESLPRWDGTTALRFKVPEVKTYEWHDEVRGTLSAGPEALDDFILIKSDGYPTYNFAHIIDDLLMGTTHIFRGDEFISSTPKFLSVYDALEIEYPKFISLSPILGAEGTKKLGKRDGSKDILDYKREGYLPEAMMNYLAFIGWNPGGEKEIFSKEEFLQAFSLSGVHTSGGKASEEKLNWFNKKHLDLLSDDDFYSKAEPFVSEKLRSQPSFASRFRKIVSNGPDGVPVLRERITHFGDISRLEEEGNLSFYFETPSYDVNLLLCPEKQRKGKENITLQDLVPVLEELKNIISNADDATISTISITDIIMPYADKEGRGFVLWPLRIALYGKEVSPDPFTMISIIGKEEALARLIAAIEKITNASKI